MWPLAQTGMVLYRRRFLGLAASKAPMVQPGASGQTAFARLRNVGAKSKNSAVGEELCSENRRMLCPRVSQRADYCGSFETGSTEFIDECTCILCASDSRKPVGIAGLEMLRQGSLKRMSTAPS